MSNSDITVADAGEQPRSLYPRWHPFKIALIVSALVNLAVILLGTALIRFFDMAANGGFSSDAELMSQANLIDGVARYIPFVAYGVLFLTVIVMLMWKYRAMKNLHIIRSKHVDMSPGWVVGWYFIPFANLVMPYRAMDEIWDGSHLEMGEIRKGSYWLGLWWLGWLGSNIIVRVSSAIADNGAMSGDEIVDFDLFNLALYLEIVGNVISIAATIFLFLIARRITRLQEDLGTHGQVAAFD